MKLRDWLGNEYGPGDKVIYPVGISSSVEMQMAEVLDIVTVYSCPIKHTWKRLDEGAEIPFKKHWENGELVDSDERVRTELRVRLQPLGIGSRRFGYRNTEDSYWLDPDGNRVKNLDKMYAELENEHGPQYERGSYSIFTTNTHWQPEDFGYSRVTDAITPKTVIISAGVANITKI